LGLLFLLRPAVEVGDDMLSEVPGDERSRSENPVVTPSFAPDLLPNQTSTAEFDRELLALLQSSSTDLGRRVRESTVTENFVELSLVVVVSVTSRVVDPTNVDHNVQRIHFGR
jgi:hypothetical protein